MKTLEDLKCKLSNRWKKSPTILKVLISPLLLVLFGIFLCGYFSLGLLFLFPYFFIKMLMGEDNPWG